MHIPRHRPIRLLGRGGMGEVWLAERVSEVGASKLVALKVMTIRVGTSQGRETFLHEARVSMSMNHPNVVQVFDAGIEQGTAWLDLEYVEGVDLSRIAVLLRAHGHLPSEDAIVHLGRSLLQGLAHAHGLRSAPGGAGVVHRDVSPQNVLVGLHGQVKINDFGIARVLQTVPSATSPMGKLRYMAPEQAHGRAQPASDLFGVGAILHELASGRKFRDHIRVEQMLAAALEGAVAPVGRSLAPALDQLLRGLLGREPQHRFASAAAALSFMDGHGLIADATKEWAQLSSSAFEAVGAARPAGHHREHSLTGDPTEAATIGTAVGTGETAPTRTRAPDRASPGWVAPVGVAGSAVVVLAGAALAWRTLWGPEPAEVGEEQVVRTRVEREASPTSEPSGVSDLEPATPIVEDSAELEPEPEPEPSELGAEVCERGHPDRVQMFVGIASASGQSLVVTQRLDTSSSESRRWLAAYDVETLAPVWESPGTNAIDAAALGDGVVAVPVQRAVSVFDASTGAALWTKRFDDDVRVAAIVPGAVVLSAGRDSIVLDRRTGEDRDELTLPAGLRRGSGVEPVVVATSTAPGIDPERFPRLEQHSWVGARWPCAGPVTDTCWEDPIVGVYHRRGAAGRVTFAAAGWDVEFEKTTLPNHAALLTRTVASADPERLVVARAGVASEQMDVVAVDARTGARLWSRQLPRPWTGTRMAVRVDQDRVFVQSLCLLSLDAETGRVMAFVM